MRESGQAGPYFFLSYAHTPKRDDSDSLDPDYWITRLYRDLCEHITEQAGARHGGIELAGEIGFMDRDMRPGSEWPFQLSRALASCRVFVPLYSRRYFASAHCGREWSAFSRRLPAGPRGDHDAAGRIIPALWHPVDPSLLPDAARAIQFAPEQLGRLYAEHGFYGLMKLGRFRDDYEMAVYRLAKRIIDVAERSPVPPGPAEDYATVENAFEPERVALHGGKRVMVTVVAPDWANLPDERDWHRYGDTARDWRPYRGDRTIADQAADVLQAAGYRAEIGTLADHAGELLADAPPAAPAVLLVDPWAAMVAETRTFLHQVAVQGNPWVGVIVIWNRKGDPQTAEMEDKLRAYAEVFLARELAEARAAARFIAEVETIEDFRALLPAVVNSAARFHLRYAAASPPEGAAPFRSHTTGSVSVPGLVRPGA